jgi:hypothetical protein
LRQSWRDEHAAALFPARFAGTWLANDRLAKDLAPQPVRQQALFGTEPLVDVMALCGYARIFTSIHGHGIWEQVRSYWDTLLGTAKDAHGIIRRLILSLGLRENPFMLTTAAVHRTQLRIRAEQAMAAVGIGRTASFRSIADDYEANEDGGSTAGHPDPAVAALAAWGFARAEAEDLFVVEYLRYRPEAVGIPMPRGVKMLAGRLDGLSGHARSGAQSPESPEPDTAGIPETGGAWGTGEQGDLR